MNLLCIGCQAIITGRQNPNVKAKCFSCKKERQKKAWKDWYAKNKVTRLKKSKKRVSTEKDPWAKYRPKNLSTVS